MDLLVSIITVNLNNVDGLKKTVGSIQTQDKYDFEWIFIDGVSTDGSWEYVNQLRDDGEFQFPIKLISEKDTGIYDAMNKGISHAKGKYLLFLNSGDGFKSGQAISAFAGEYALVSDLKFYSFAIEIEGHGVGVIYPEVLTEEFFWSTSLCHQSTFIHRLVFEELGVYNTEFKIIADRYHFIEGIFKRGYSYKIINSFQLVVYNGDGISSTQYALRNSERDLLFTELFGAFAVRCLKELSYFRSLRKNRLIWGLMLFSIQLKAMVLRVFADFVIKIKKLIVNDDPKKRNIIQRKVVGLFQKVIIRKRIEVE